MQYRVFISDPGMQWDSTKYEFVAAFPNKKLVKNYVQYLFGKPKAMGKAIIIKKVKSCKVDPSEGKIDGLISSIGEEIEITEVRIE